MASSEARKARSLPALLLGLLSVVILVAFWQVAASSVGKEIILPPPFRVVAEFLTLLPSPSFLAALGGTFLRGVSAFALSAGLGLALGFVAGRSPTFAALMAPLMTTIRATPVLALILLALLWFPSDFVPVFAAFLMAFPVMAASGAAGARAAPPELLEMARLFRVPGLRVLFQLRVPAALPQVLTGARSALGLCWKVVVAGEVLSQPERAIGTGMQMSRILLDTPRVFAWALAAILLCGLTEWLFGALIGSGKSNAVPA
jgi:NitT/TauT family transport system permease protein